MSILSNFALSAGTLIACLTALWAISYKIKDASIIDIFWGAGFGIVAIVCLVNFYTNSQIGLPPYWWAKYIWLLAAMPIIWAVRLSGYLAKRNLGHGEDKRYVAMQERAAKQGVSEDKWRKRSYLNIFLGQGLLIMIVSAPIWIAMATGQPHYVMTNPECIDGGCLDGGKYEMTYIGPLALIGAALWLIGFLFETIGDMQLAKFMRENKNYSGPQEDKPVLNTGLWKYTRHPNYFGNACMWWGIWIVACAAPWGWVTIFAPIVMTILLTRVSGRDLLERNMKKRKAYRDYIENTSGFFPLPPKTKAAKAL